MEHSAIAEHVRDTATKHLQSEGTPITPQAIEEQGKWLIALFYAERLSDVLTLKEIASLYLAGLKPITSIDAECKSLVEDLDDEDDCAAFIDFLNLQ